MRYTSISALTWANSSKSAILATVSFDDLGTVPFLASPDDVEPHGREIFARAVAGDFGPIADAPAATPPKSITAPIGRNLVVVTDDVAKLLRAAAFTATALGDASVSIVVSGVAYSGTLAEAQTALRSYLALT